MAVRRRNTAVALTTIRLLAIPLGIASQGAVARLLGLADLGRYALFLSLVSGLGIVMAFGLGDSATREVAARPGGAVRLVGTCVAMVSVPVVAVWLATGSWVLEILKMNTTQFMLVLVLLGGAGKAASQIVGSIARGAGRLNVATLTEVATVSVIVLLALGVAYGARWDVTLRSVLVIHVGALWVTAALAAGVLYWTGRRPAGGTTSLRQARLLTVSSLPLLGNQVALLVSGTAAIFVIGSSLEPIDIARYAIAARITSLVTIPGVVIQQMAAADIARGWEQGTIASSTAWLRRAVTLATLAAATYLAFALVAWRPLVRVVFGATPQHLTVVLLILGLGQLTQVATGPCGNALIMVGRERATFHATLLGALIVGVVIVPLVGVLGVVGAGIATATGIVVVNLANASKVQSRAGIATWFQLSSIWQRD